MFQTEPFVDQVQLDILARVAIERAENGKAKLTGPERLEKATSLFLEVAAQAMHASGSEEPFADFEASPSTRAIAKGYIHQTHTLWQAHRNRFARS